MVAPTKPRMTSARYLDRAETLQRSDLIDGEIIVSPPSLEHQDLVLKLAFLIKQMVAHGTVMIAPVDVVLDDYNTVQPDVLWVAPDSACVREQGKYLRGAPELVIEVLSPSTARQDRGKKFALYQRHGVREYWLVDPDAAFIEVWVRDGDALARMGDFGAGESFTSPALGVDVPLDGVF